MAREIDPPADNTGSGKPGDANYVPSTGSNSKISVVVSSTNVVFTSDQIAAAGGPWPNFKIRVTAFNSAGAASPVEKSYP